MSMKRREFITLLGGAVAWPLAARAQQVERLRRIGFLGGGTASLQPIYDGLLQGMREPSVLCPPPLPCPSSAVCESA
jgi:putative ABC transport system substrate-binding protein